MHSIVVATDFSEVANNAVRFACEMAADFQKTVTVFHSYIIPVSFGDNPMPVMPIEDSKAIATESMDKLVDSLKTLYSGTSIESHITFGDITDSLEDYCERNTPWLIIVGNSAEDHNTLWFGSNVISTLKNLPYRTMAVPASAQYKTPRKICLAADYKHVYNKFPSGDLTEIVSKAGAELHVLNVDHNNKQFGTEVPQDAAALEAQLQSANPQYHYVESDNTDEAITKFIAENNIDWLVIVPHKYGFWEGLFHKSHTTALARTGHVPLLALHEH
ncbi:MAG: universal stress protein [Sphingobacteriales bacterium]|nr:MAG: universal stress protein [Sphingobacteriales bacterium]